MTKLGLTILELTVAVGVPMLIALLAPRRWRLTAIGLWVLAPLLILVVVGAGEIISGKAAPADLGKLAFGIMLIGSVLAAPWLVACGVGFGLGAFLRRRREPKAPSVESAPSAPPMAGPATTEVEPRPAPTPYAPPLDPGEPTLSPPGGWQAAHVGFDHDDLVLDGLPIWSLTWRQESDLRVMLAHPAHPKQEHAFTIYAADDGARATRFAAAELSNSVWGFYRWIVPADLAVGVSADASLRYEHDLGPHEGRGHDRMEPCARLYDAQTDALLFDGAAWQSSRIVPQADGSLLLSIEQRDRQTLFHIRPAARTFEDLTAPGGNRPLADLADAAAAARAACDDAANAYLGRCVAADGSLMVELEWAEWGNSHWLRAPRVTEIASGRVLLNLWGTDWDASVSFPRRRAVALSFRRYHYGGGAEVEIELTPERYVLLTGASAIFGPLGDLPEALEAESRRTAAAAPARQMITAPPARRWGVALMILVGAVIAIAGATLISLKLEGDAPKPKLDTIPAMPELPDATGGPRIGGI
jgi:hypothetical protein